jgi:hypothetical protein
MNGGRRLFRLLGLVAVLGLAPAALAAAGAGVGWGTAIEVPGTAALGGSAVVNSVSCGSVGYCAAGGPYVDGSGDAQAFVVDEKNGVWGDAVEVPGMAALNVGGSTGWAAVNSVSCAGAGNCAAGGTYADSSGNAQAFVVDEKNGVWGTAVEVPGTAALNVGGSADVLSVSCGSVGNCVAVGHYTDANHIHGAAEIQAFVVDEKNGVWGTAVEVPGTAALNAGGDAGVTAVSCESAGNCAAGGFYTEASGGFQGSGEMFVVDEKNGVWGKALKLRGNAAFSTSFAGSVNSISCARVGSCVAGGFYHPHHNTPQRGRQTAFVVAEMNGVWGKAIDVPRMWRKSWEGATVSSVSCASVGNCAAGGTFANDGSHAFVVAEKNGVWSTPIVVPGTTPISNSSAIQANAAVTSISCAKAGVCAVGGYTNVGPLDVKAFVETERKNGTWGKAVQVPGTATLTAGYAHVAHVLSVSCTRTGNCVAAGSYGDASANSQPFVTTP